MKKMKRWSSLLILLLAGVLLTSCMDPMGDSKTTYLDVDEASNIQVKIRSTLYPVDYTILVGSRRLIDKGTTTGNVSVEFKVNAHERVYVITQTAVRSVNIISKPIENQ